LIKKTESPAKPTGLNLTDLSALKEIKSCLVSQRLGNTKE